MEYELQYLGRSSCISELMPLNRVYSGGSENAIRTLLFACFLTPMICELLHQFKSLYLFWILAFPYSSCCLKQITASSEV